MNITQGEEINAANVWLFRHQKTGQVLGEFVEKRYSGKLFRSSWMLEGKTATFWCVTHDETITRQDAIDFCKAIVEGRYKTIHINLRDL